MWEQGMRAGTLQSNCTSLQLYFTSTFMPTFNSYPPPTMLSAYVYVCPQCFCSPDAHIFYIKGERKLRKHPFLDYQKNGNFKREECIRVVT